ncbi:MAG: hypothetical protein HC884_17240 [Chloroflexaceae bacterium]|nr:hypothetical protein [Chloroflexaceae bacterium]
MSLSLSRTEHGTLAAHSITTVQGLPMIAIAQTNLAASQGGIYLKSGSTTLDFTAMHPLIPGYHKQITMHGKLSNFTGGDLVLQVHAISGDGNTDVKFGEVDERFGRHITVIAGL